MTHAPAPWSASRWRALDFPEGGYGIFAGGRPLAYVWGPDCDVNARLIAAAPALLEAAEALLAAAESNNQIEWLGTWGELVTAVLQGIGEAST